MTVLFRKWIWIFSCVTLAVRAGARFFIADSPISTNRKSIRKSLVRTWSCNMTYKSSQHRWKSLYKNQYRCDFQSYTIDSPFYQSIKSFSTFNFISMADDCIIWIRCSVSCDQHDFEFKVIFIWRFHNAQIFKIIHDRRFD